jgi:hypothetical protein
MGLRWPQRPSLGATALTGLVPVAFQQVPGQHFGVMTWYRPGKAGNETMEHSPEEGRLTVLALERFGRRPKKGASKRRVL